MAAILATARLPRERDPRGMESPERADRRGLVDIRAKTPTRGRGPEPQSGARGSLPFGRQHLADGVRSVPWLHRLNGTPVVRTAFSAFTALSGVRAYAQDYLGSGIVPTPQPR